MRLNLNLRLKRRNVYHVQGVIAIHQRHLEQLFREETLRIIKHLEIRGSLSFEAVNSSRRYETTFAYRETSPVFNPTSQLFDVYIRLLLGSTHLKMSETKPTIDLYTTQTPNGIKISITLEELGLERSPPQQDNTEPRQTSIQRTQD